MNTVMKENTQRKRFIHFVWILVSVVFAGMLADVKKMGMNLNSIAMDWVGIDFLKR